MTRAPTPDRIPRVWQANAHHHLGDSRSAILFVANFDVLAHASRALVVAQALRERFDGTIAGAGNGKYGALFREAGFPFYELAGIAPKLQQDVAQRKMRLLNRQWVREGLNCFRGMIESELELYRSVNPDLVVMDARMSVLISTEALGIPCIRIVNASMLITPSVVKSVVAKKTFTRSIGVWSMERVSERMLRPFVSLTSKLVLSVLLRLLNEFRRSYNLKPLSRITDLPLRAIILPDLEPMAPIVDLPPNSHYIGPVVWQPASEVPTALRNLHDLIYVSMGSTGNPAVFNLLISAFNQMPEVRVAMAVGNLVDLEQLDPLPENVQVYRFLPGIDMAQRAQLVICHGGLGTIYQALSQGVPVLGIPFMVFHEAPALDRLETLGLGRKLDEANLTPGRIVQTVRDMLGDDSYRRATQAIAAQFRLEDGPRRAATIILNEIKIRKGYEPSQPTAPPSLNQNNLIS